MPNTLDSASKRSMPGARARWGDVAFRDELAATATYVSALIGIAIERSTGQI